MTGSAAALLAEALKLSEEDRGELADKLMESLDPEGADADADAAWAEEIRQRIEDLESGRVKPIPWEEARRLITEDRDEFDEE